MHSPYLNLAAPTVLSDGTVVFSAYGVGFGYGTFAISPTVMCGALGATGQSGLEIRSAFESNRARIANAVARQLPLDGNGALRFLCARDL